MDILKFVGPTSLPEPGCVATTFRVGRTWEQAYPGDEYPGFVCGTRHAGECGPECFPVGPVQIIAKWSGPLGLVPESALALHHEPACRTPDGLVAALRAIYGPDVSLHSHVVVLYFRMPE